MGFYSFYASQVLAILISCPKEIPLYIHCLEAWVAWTSQLIQSSPLGCPKSVQKNWLIRIKTQSLLIGLGRINWLTTHAYDKGKLWQSRQSHSIIHAKSNEQVETFNEESIFMMYGQKAGASILMGLCHWHVLKPNTKGCFCNSKTHSKGNTRGVCINRGQQVFLGPQ
jgi:hypothetical protein